MPETFDPPENIPHDLLPDGDQLSLVRHLPGFAADARALLLPTRDGIVVKRFVDDRVLGRPAAMSIIVADLLEEAAGFRQRS